MFAGPPDDLPLASSTSRDVRPGLSTRRRPARHVIAPAAHLGLSLETALERDDLLTIAQERRIAVQADAPTAVPDDAWDLTGNRLPALGSPERIGIVASAAGVEVVPLPLDPTQLPACPPA